MRSSSDVVSRAVIASRPEPGPRARRPYRSLRKREEFSTVYRKGRRRRCGAVTVIADSGPPGDPTVGFVAGKKVGSAVYRNRAKRRLREAATRSQLKRDTVYVLIADRGVLDASFARLVEWLDRCIEELSAVGEER